MEADAGVWSAGAALDGLSVITSLIALDISNNRINAALPPSWSALSLLTRLNASTNGISGPLMPSWFGGTPSLAALQELVLASNALTGTIPVSWASGVQLQTLDLSYNKLKGAPFRLFADTGYATVESQFRPALSALVNLTRLDISNNLYLGGTIPRSWSHLTALTYFSVDVTSWCGTMPGTFPFNVHPAPRGYDPRTCDAPEQAALLESFAAAYSGSPLLSTWDYSANRLLVITDSDLFGSLPNPMPQFLTYLELKLSSGVDATNVNVPYGFEGDFPAAWFAPGGMPVLQRLTISGSKIQGTLPVDVTNLVTMTYLDLSNNAYVAGTLPPEWGGMGLYELNLASNGAIAGTIPGAWDGSLLESSLRACDGAGENCGFTITGTFLCGDISARAIQGKTSDGPTSSTSRVLPTTDTCDDWVARAVLLGSLKPQMRKLDPSSPCYTLASFFDPTLRIAQWNRPELGLSAASGITAIDYTLQIMRIHDCNTNAALTMSLPPLITALQVYELHLYNNNIVDLSNNPAVSGLALYDLSLANNGAIAGTIPGAWDGSLLESSLRACDGAGENCGFTITGTFLCGDISARDDWVARAVLLGSLKPQMRKLDPSSPCYTLASFFDPTLRIAQWNRPELGLSAASGITAIDYTLQIMRIHDCNTNAALTMSLPPLITALQVYELHLYNNNIVGEKLDV
ncbi:hypothetical protein HXX76_012828 [Chlamydomonas incerta]|uniref:Uncharacterized protein n=1 Tax=Chlamydomonas incerta TaxID=51695 RepID=A0A835SVS4_CHLIN|nr:hypothetical protein HXX76_012828 [Chlamydomonas incerta]|eukprot:KAG2426771.1 hypothetical protein HXX76_012828 [Chlamydomonas incerta]